MIEILLRFAVLLLVGGLVVALVIWGRHFVNGRRLRALNAEPLVTIDVSKSENEDNSSATPGEAAPAPIRASVRILAFSSEDCVQCRQLQVPVLRRVVEAKGDNIVSVIHIDAPGSPELTERYHVLTVPTTVLLDTTGKAHAVNYGFTNAQSLIKQIDEILASNGAQEALW